MKKILITGGAGFIGSHLVRLFVRSYPDYVIFNLDKLTYAGNLANLADVQNAPNYRFIRADIADAPAIAALFREHRFDAVIHLAAESHVDRSIDAPADFALTNVLGTVNLLDAARATWLPRGRGNAADAAGKLFYHVSTDEVFGSLGPDGVFSEETKYDPRSPYAASKASSDHFVRAYHHTYGLPIVISNCSNNYGAWQFPEKLIPLIINNIRRRLPLPVYGRGANVRDWLWVEDHARAIDVIFHRGRVGETYAVGAHNEWRNIDLVELLCDTVDAKLGHEPGDARKLITFVTDRAGHDLRYAMDASKLRKELGWSPSVTFQEGIERTVEWYLHNDQWLDDVTSGAYNAYYEKMYGGRGRVTE